MAKILIVDDEQINLDFFEVMLTKLGFEVVKASDGEEALELVQETEPDLIVLDNIMPRLSGWEVTRMLKHDPEYRDYSAIPIIMFSAMDDVKDKIEGFELGVEDYITKPFNFSEVLARIKAVLRNHELGQQVLNREERIALAVSMNDQLIGFVKTLRAPLERVGTGDDAAVAAVAREHARQTLERLDDLEQQISIYGQRVGQLRDRAITLDAIDERYQKHLQNLRDNADSIV
ncbi:MAG: response regulator [Spirochaetaceae bacterium]|nr:MAG: response regulator [Spirochaetaceae bacterium]